MSLYKARDLIEQQKQKTLLWESLKREEEISKEDGIGYLDDLLLEQESSLNSDESLIRFIFNIRETLRNYDEKKIPYKIFYDEKTGSLNYRVIN